MIGATTTEDEPDEGGRADRFLAYVDELVGDDAESGEDHVPSSAPGLPDVLAIDYADTPEDGLLLAVTYGLSVASHDEWTVARPELSLCVESDDPVWALRLAELVDRHRGDRAFAYGEAFDLDGPICDETDMDGFIIAGPLVMDDETAHVDVGEDLPIRILGAYPAHASERAFVREHGVEAFWELDWDPYDPERGPAVR